MVSLLLEHGASAVVVDNCGRSCLHWAAHLGWEVIAELLLEAGADLSAKDLSGRTPQDIAQPRIAGMIKAEASRRAVAFAMGQHARLGAGSRVWELDEGVVQMVLALV